MIAIGCPVRNREGILHEYLSALEKIEGKKQFLFLANDCTDRTVEILQSFQQRYPNTVLKVIKSNDDDIPTTERSITGYARDNYKHLADLRNQFISLFLKETGCQYLLSVDSDIIVPQNIVSKLKHIVDSDKFRGRYRIAAAAISNIKGKDLDGHIPGNFMVRIPRTNRFRHPSSYPLEGTFLCDMAGAVSLIPREVLEKMEAKKHVYEAHSQGEDCGFALNVPDETYFITHMGCRCQHRM